MSSCFNAAFQEVNCLSKEICKNPARVLKIAAAIMKDRTWNREHSMSEKGGSEMSFILQTSRLTKIIGGKELVKDVDMHVKKGEIYGFLGPNGA